MVNQPAKFSRKVARPSRSAPHLRPRPLAHALLVGLKVVLKTPAHPYDLISGNVHYLHYQRGAPDQFTYHYKYDKLNRLSQVFASEIETAHSRSNLWKRDAAYTYYDHGPLKRTVIGQESLQGLDYAYTLQGWIKGLNGSLGNDYGAVAAPDMSMDGYPEATSLAADPVEHRDLYRYANQYFHEDYKPIKGGILNPMDNVLPPDYELFNGNIVRHYQATIADDFRTAGLVGEYDQLNRLRYGTHAFYGTPPTRDRSLASALEAPTFDSNGNIYTMDRHYTTTDGEAQHNRLNYGYKGGTNLLTSVQATVTGPTSDWQPFDLLRGQHTYAYDASGNLTNETNDAGATTITWNPYGKVDRVATPDGLTSFGYGPDQNRWAKSLERDGETRTTYYVRDAQGNTLATYSKEGGAAGATLTWKQQYLYGSARLGEVTMDRLMGGSSTPTDFGTRRYELSNHLGNVTTVFEEYTSGYQEGNGQGEFTAPVLTSFREYMPFGLGLERGPGGGRSYRYAFNGKEVDSEGEWGATTNPDGTKRSSTYYDYGFRIYNPALGRFLSVDPLTSGYPMLTPYQFASNTPIWAIDLDGLEADPINDGVQTDAPEKQWEPVLLITDSDDIVNESYRPYELVRDMVIGAFETFGAFTQLGDYHVADNAERMGNTERAGELRRGADQAVAVIVQDAALGYGMSKAFAVLKKLVPVRKLDDAAVNNYLYRVQGGVAPNASKIRFKIENDILSIAGDDMLYVTVNDKTRALEFLAKRGDEAYLFEAKVDQSFLDRLLNEAVDQVDGKNYPGRPQKVDQTKTSGSYGIPKEYFDDLLNSVEDYKIE